MYNGLPLLQEKLPRLPWPAVANHRVLMLDPTHGAPGSPPAPCPPSATARFPPSRVSPPHPACSNTDIHNNTNELWLGLLFQGSFSVGREEVPLTRQTGYGAELDAASASMTTRADRWDKLYAERGAVLQNSFCGGGAGAGASGSELLIVTALLVA